jgi:hypothetical protein
MEKAAGLGKGSAAAGTERRHAAITANLRISGSPNAFPFRDLTMEASRNARHDASSEW